MDKIEELIQKSSEFVEAVDKVQQILDRAKQELDVEKFQNLKQEAIDDVKMQSLRFVRPILEEAKENVNQLCFKVTHCERRINDLCKLLIGFEEIPAYVKVISNEFVVYNPTDTSKQLLSDILKKYDYQKFIICLSVEFDEGHGMEFGYFIPCFEDSDGVRGLEFYKNGTFSKTRWGGFANYYVVQLVNDIKKIEDLVEQYQLSKKAMVRAVFIKTCDNNQAMQ